MDNRDAISEKFRKLRIDRVNNWKPNVQEENYDYLFPIEKDFLTRIKNVLTNNGFQIFIPLKYPYELDREYHIYISYLIEALDVLPLKMDLSFDFSWKGLELYMGKAYENHRGQKTSNVSDLIKYSRSNYWYDIITNNVNILNNINRFLELMPSQSYEYLGKRMFKEYTISNPRNNPLYTRLAMTNGNIDSKIDHLLKDTFTKYGNPDNGDKTRKVGRLIYKLLTENNISLPKFDNQAETNQYSLHVKERIDLVVNGLLYTYRNERFHGNTFSPFKSSKASLKTYSHAHYLFLWTYFLVNITKLYLNNVTISPVDVERNMTDNIDIFEKLYGRHLGR
ncbi:hypothetical protein [Chryseobacterium sp.]|uniref:hypothetical protein n=1 Tax=Chryseobacterium sp. TaxID=1871047 RepID=UPI0024E1E156|nr:hypothetical protein [Chryseobacterium sp.]